MSTVEPGTSEATAAQEAVAGNQGETPDTGTTSAADETLADVDGLDTVLADTAQTFGPDAAANDNATPVSAEPLEDGAVIAEQSGTEIKAENRQEQTFGSEEEAIAHARTLGTPAAVLAEGNRFAVYEADHQSWGINPFGEEITLNDAANKDTRDDITDTDLTARVDNLVAIVTSDDYAMRFDPGVGNEAVIDRVGSPLGPLDGALQAHGPGLENLTDTGAVEDAFELAMRDTAYAALDAAEGEAIALQEELDGPGLSEAGETALDTALANLDDIDAQIAAVDAERSAAMRQVYDDAPFIAKAFATDAIIAQQIEVGKPFRDQIAALEGQRSQAAAGFPLALRIEDREAFRELSHDEQAEMLSGEIDDVLEDVRQTRTNLDTNDLDLWQMRGLVSATADQLGLQGEQLEIVQDKTDWEGTMETLHNIGEGVLAVGLAVGGFFTGGATWAGLGLLGASAAVSVYSAVNVTDDYQDLNAAANTGLDPAQGLVPPDAAPHWGWVAAAWVGVGLDAAAVAKAVPALRAISGVAEAVDAGQPVARETAEAALRQAATEANVPPGQIDDFVRRALPIITGEGGPPPVFREVGDALFTSRYGVPDAEAVTTIRQVGDDFQIEIVTRAGADPTAAIAAKNEELGHLLQVSDPAWRSQVEQLSEEALSDWGTRSLQGRATAYRAQHELEIDLVRQRIDTLTDAAAGGDDVARAQALDELPVLEERLAGMNDALDELNGPTAPSWLADAPPPRLFNRPAAGATQAAHREALGLLPSDVPDGFALRRRQNGSYEVYRDHRNTDHWDAVREGGDDPATMGARLVREDGVYRIEPRTISADEVRLTAEQQRAVITRDFGEPITGFNSLESALESRSAYQSAYSRSYSGVFRQLDDLGIPPSQVLDNIGNVSEAGFGHALRGQLREAIVDNVMSRPPARRAEALAEFYRASPEGFQGQLFSDFRQRSLGPDLRVVDTAPNDTRLLGTQRFGDGLVDVSNAADGGAGPRRTGTYLVEDKSSGTAFSPSQFDQYNDALRGGTLRTANGETQGVTYFFPDADAAKRVTDYIAALRRQGEAVSPHIHVGFYNDAGLLEWSR